MNIAIVVREDGKRSVVISSGTDVETIPWEEFVTGLVVGPIVALIVFTFPR